MIKNKEGKAGIIILIIIVIVIAAGVGIFNIFSQKLVKEGEVLNGTWKDGESTITLDVQKKTYSFSLDGKTESGNISSFQYDIEHSTEDYILYNLQFDGNGTYSVALHYNVKEKDNTSFTLISDKFSKEYTLSLQK